MKEKVRVGLYGYGKAAWLHAQAVRDSSKAELVAVCGRNRERRNAFAGKWNIGSRDSPDEMAHVVWNCRNGGFTEAQVEDLLWRSAFRAFRLEGRL